MARTRNNCITHGTSGKMGNVVFTSDGTMRSKPDVSRRVWTPLQKLHQERVAEAKTYARFVICDPELNEYYGQKAARKHGIGAWHLAIRDYYNPPEISSADFRNDRFHTGNQVIISATDKFEVKQVIVSFIYPGLETFNSGHAVQEPDPSLWRYVFPGEVEFAPGLRIIIRAMDIAGNITTETLAWPFDRLNEINFTSEYKAGKGTKRMKSQLRIRKDE